ncbi:MAG: D-alanyl-D-alanine-carboxypeptidase/D-alanyl-D-alanine-endopeptidase [Planctomycetota bacterium]|jgi:D-alanyl-D-alanine-carboxypeptidase/D-alanyl-D-alanine-endopeptidase
MELKTRTLFVFDALVDRALLLLACCFLSTPAQSQNLTEAAASPTLDELMTRVDDSASTLVSDGLTVGMVVGIVRGDERLIRGYGEVVLGGGDEPNADTVYEIGSVSKVFTGILLADAAQRELLDVEDTVQDIVGDAFTMPMYEEEPIRLWHLSTHTSGLPRMPGNFKPANPDDPYADYELGALYDYVSGYKLRRAPGQEYAYSNLAVALLGNVLAHTQETSYESLVSARITGPLGMDHTAVTLTPWMQERFAQAYDMDQGEKLSWNLGVFAGAGGIRSNMNDMLIFARAALHPELTALDEALASSMEVRYRGSTGVMIGLGWHAGSGGATRWHNGQTGGYHSYLALWPEQEVAVVLLSNTTAGLLDLLGENILLALMGHPPRDISYRKAAELDRDLCAELVGQYQLGIFQTLTVTLEDMGLFAKMSMQPKLRIYPDGEGKFFYRVVEAEIEFTRDDEGKVSGLAIAQAETVTQGKRKE